VNIRNNARTTPNMRVLIVGRRQAGETRRSIAGAVGVSPATVRKWLRRHESEGAAGLQDRTSRRIACARGSIRADHAGRSPAPEPSILLKNRPRDRAVARDRGPRRKGWDYLHLAADDHARLAYSEILAG
jgi:transposase-like protein